MGIWDRTPKEIEEAVASDTRCFEVTFAHEDTPSIYETQEVWGSDSTVASNLGLWLSTRGHINISWKEIEV